MQYNIDEFKRRIADIDGGMKTVATKYGASTVQIDKLLNRSKNPRFKSMRRLINAIVAAEEDQAKAKAENPEFFLH